MSAERFMRRAAELSTAGMRAGAGGPFGAVVVLGSDIVGEGNNRVLVDNDPTAHAEIVAIRQAAAKLQRFDLSACEIYTSCEPCPMCLGAILWARLAKMYFANTRADATVIGFDDALFYDEIALPIANRKLSSIRLACPEASAAFAEWKGLTIKTRY